MARHPVSEERETYVFTKDAVLRAVESLVSQPVHEHFLGYLALLQARRAEGVERLRSSVITDFFDQHMRIGGTPAKPYVKPFRSRGHGKLVLFNANPAGSFAPSSIRETLGRVIVQQGPSRKITYSLQRNHAQLAAKYLLMGSQIPTMALTIFLYRDFGFTMSAPDLTLVAKFFREEFGLREDVKSENSAYERIFRDDIHEFSGGDLIAMSEAI